MRMRSARFANLGGVQAFPAQPQLFFLTLLLALHATASDALFHSLLNGNSQAPRTDPRELVDCINRKYTPSAHGTTWDEAMDDILPSFVAAGSWWSNKPLLIPLTVVTQLSANRVTQLWAQCKSWPGPLSAAVHISIVQSSSTPLNSQNSQLLTRTVRAMSDFHLAIEKDPSACRLDLVLVYEVYQEKRATMLYPVNQLRNLARLQARTELVGLMDVDMLVSSKLANHLIQYSRSETMRNTCSKRTVYILPAFETYGPNAAMMADKLVRQSKTHLVRSVGQGLVAPFDSVRFPIGHNTTNFKRWYRDDQQYKITYAYRFEPWIIADRKAIPWHDVRFRGYGQNKIVHIAHTNASGFEFVVHPTGFIIHRAHELTAARIQLVADMKEDSILKKAQQGGVGKNTVYGHSHKLWEEAKADMALGKYVPVLDPATKHCMRQLSWWK